MQNLGAIDTDMRARFLKSDVMVQCPVGCMDDDNARSSEGLERKVRWALVQCLYEQVVLISHM